MTRGIPCEYLYNKGLKIKIIMDNDKWFSYPFKNRIGSYEKQAKLNSHLYRLKLFHEKYLDRYRKAIRPLIFTTLFSLGLIRFYKERTPLLYSEYKTKRYEKDKWEVYKKKHVKKVADGQDHSTDAWEILIYDEIRELYKYVNKNYIPREILGKEDNYV